MTHTVRGFAAAGLALLALAAPTQRAQAAAFELITPAEARQSTRAEADAPPLIRPRFAGAPRSAMPAIRVLEPSAPGATVPAPLRIELAFTAAPGTHIVPATFRVLYGLLKIDLTERLRSHSTVTEAGVVVEQAQVPDGLHRLFLQVADDQGNLAEQELRIRVGATS